MNRPGVGGSHQKEFFRRFCFGFPNCLFLICKVLHSWLASERARQREKIYSRDGSACNLRICPPRFWVCCEREIQRECELLMSGRETWLGLLHALCSD